MADFTPQIPNQSDPNWWALSKGIKQPEADKSKAALIEGVTHVGEGAVKGADFAIKQSKEDEIHAFVDKEQKDFTDTLSLKNAQVQLSKSKGGTAASADESERPDVSETGIDLSGVGLGPGGVGVKGSDTSKSTKMPVDLEQLPGDLGKLESARANGKISPTLYYQRLYSKLQAMRSQNPGYRDYIDQTMEKTTGINPANAYMRSLIGDINSLTTAKSAEDTKKMALIDHGVREGYDGMERFSNNPDAFTYGQVAAHVNPIAARKFRNAETAANFENAKRLKEHEASNAEEDMRTTIANKADDYWHNAASSSGITPKATAELIRKASTGEGPVPSTEDSKKLALKIKSDGDQYEANARSFSKKWAKYVPQDKIEKEIADHKKMWTAVSDALGGEKADYGLAAYWINQHQARVSDTQKRILDSSSGDAILRTEAAMKLDPAFGGLVVKHYSQSLLEPKIATLMNDMENEAMVQSGVNQVGDIRKTGKIVVATDHVKELREKGITDKPAYSELVSWINNIHDKKLNATTHERFADYFFRPENYDYLKEFEKESLDPANPSNRIKGQYSTFHALFAPEVRDAMFKLGEKDPKKWENFKGANHYMFKTELLPDVLSLNQLGSEAGESLRFDKDTSHFKFFATPGAASPYKERREAAVNKSLLRLNNAIDTRRGIAEKDSGVHVNEELLNDFIDMGLDITKTHIKGIPSDMVEAMVTTKKKQEEQTKKTQERFKRPQ